MQIALNEQSDSHFSLRPVDNEALEKSLTQHCRETRASKQRKCARVFFVLADTLQVYRTPEQQKARVPAPKWL